MSRWPLMLLVVLALATAGCLQSTTVVEVEDDGSGRASIEVVVDAQAVVDQAGQSPLPLPGDLIPQDTAGVCDAVRQAIESVNRPAGATIEPLDQDGRCGQRIEFTFVDPVQLTAGFETLANRDSDGPVLRQDGDRWIFDAPLIQPLDLLPRGQQAVLAEQLASQQETTYRVTLPGAKVGDTNADAVEGGTFTWEIATDDTRTRLQAITDVTASAGTFPLVPVVLGGAVLALGGTAAWLVARNRRRGQEPAVPRRPGDVMAGVPDAPGGTGPYRAPATTSLSMPPAATTIIGSATPDDPMVAEPRWDPQRSAWVADHPVEGLLIHDDTSGEWRRA